MSLSNGAVRGARVKGQCAARTGIIIFHPFLAALSIHTIMMVTDALHRLNNKTKININKWSVIK